MNFWQNLPKPIIGLAPMDGVSDAAFRYVVAKYGNPDVITTEFISVDGITHAAKNLFDDFLYHEIERPICAQVFGTDPELFYISAKIICEFGFDGMDINMGCPAKSVSARGAGAALIKTPELAQAIIKASKQGVEDWVKFGLGDLRPKLIDRIAETKQRLSELGVNLPEGQERKSIPVSVKTRVGYDKQVPEWWVEQLLLEKPAAIAMHGRTLKQLYTGLADWDAIQRAAGVVADYNKYNSEQIPFLGNGDVVDLTSAKERLRDNIDGLLIGRGSFGNPFIFDLIGQLRDSDGRPQREIDLRTKVELAIEHSAMHEQLKSPKAYVQMRKHLAWYTKGFPGASSIRAELMQANTTNDVINTLKKIEGLYDN